MFTIIDYKNFHSYEMDIAHLFEMKEADPLHIDRSSYNNKETVYISFHDADTGLVAGARLNPMMRQNLTSDTLKSYVKGFETQGVWECSFMVFQFDSQESNCDDPAALKRLTVRYYEKFCEAIITACVRFKIGTLLFLAPQSEIDHLQVFGGMHFKPKLSLDNNLCIALFQNPHRH